MSASDVVPLLKEILARLSVLEGKVGGSESNSNVSNNSTTSDVPPSVKGFDAYSTSFLDPFENACNKLGGDAQTAGSVVKKAWLEMRKIIVMAASCKEPDQASLQSLFSGVSSKIKEASTVINRNEWEKHTKTISEGISCLNW